MNGPAQCADCGSRPPPRPTDGGPPFAWCMTCTASRLRQHGEALAQRLLPNGHWESHWWRAGSTAGEAGQSLAVDLGGGKKRGRWYDYSAGEGGDLLDLIRLSQCGGDQVKALRWAQAYLRAPAPASAPGPAGARPRQATPEDTRAYIARIWREARPLAPGDLVWRYFAARGIDLARLPPIPSLRIHPGLWHRQAQRSFPALLAVIAGPDGDRIAGVHRTWLAVKDGIVDKAPVERVKLSLGFYAGGCIPLTRGSSGRSWRDPQPGELVAIGEGIEDTLSIAAAKPAWRCAAGVSLSNMLSMKLPAAIGEVVLIGQNDRPGSKAALLLPRVAAHFQQLGKKVQVRRPRDREVKDVNDLARRLRRHPAET
jgi:hypothetical protein